MNSYVGYVNCRHYGRDVITVLPLFKSTGNNRLGLCIMWIFIILHFLVEITAENSTVQIPTDITTEFNIINEWEDDNCSTSVDGICIPMCECVDTNENQIQINAWNILHKWIVTCLSQYQNPIKKDNFFQDQDSTELKTKQPKSNDFMLMSSNQIYELLEAISVYKYTAQMFVQLNESSLEYTNITDCHKYEHFEFIQSETEYLDIMYKHTWWVYIFQSYVEIPIVTIVLLLGFLLTGTLLFIFIKHKELRSESNMIVLNIAICDFLSLLIVYPTQYIIFNGIFFSDDFLEFYRISVISLTSTRALSILALGIQRLVAVNECPPDSCCGKLNKCSKIYLFISCIWGPSSAFIILTNIEFSNEYINNVIVNIMAATAVFFMVALPIAITAINCTIAIKLNRSAKQMPGENMHQVQMQARYRSARVVNFLCFVFWITHGPFLFAVAYLLGEMKSDDIFSLESKYVSCAFHGLFCLSAFFNPVALAIMSKNFKILFK